MNNPLRGKKYLKKILWATGTAVFLYIINSSLLVQPVKAVCPACTVAVAAGLGLSRFLGIDDTISGLWIGALILSASLWLINWIEKQSKFTFRLEKFIKKIKFITVCQFINSSVIVLMYLFLLLPLYWFNIIGHPLNTLWGIDKLLLGILLGSLIFLAGTQLDKKVRKRHGKQFFNYQKVVFPVGLLIIISIILYFSVK
jgi:hypothetical protein